MKQPFYKKIFLSIYSPSFLADTVKEKFSKVVVYLLLLLTLVGLITGLVKTFVFVKDMEQFIEVVDSDAFPEFELKNGVFSIDSTEPIIITVEDQLVFIVDQEGNKNINDLAGYQTGYLITNEGLTISMIGRNPDYYDFGLIKNFYFSKTELINEIKLIMLLSKFFLPVIFILLTFVSNLFRSIFVFLVALSLRNATRMHTIKNLALYQITLYSMTAGIIIYELAILIPLFITLPGWLLNLSIMAPFILFYLPSSIILFKGFKQLVMNTAPKAPEA